MELGESYLTMACSVIIQGISLARRDCVAAFSKPISAILVYVVTQVNYPVMLVFPSRISVNVEVSWNWAFLADRYLQAEYRIS